MTHDDIDRRRVLRRTAGTAVGAGVLAFGGALAVGDRAAASGGSPDGNRLSTHPVVGTWRGLVTLPHEVEVALFTFLPGGFFLSFADGIHIATGRWAPTGSSTVRFKLWQVLPQDLNGLPHRYSGEVQARHEAQVNGDTLASTGTWRGLDIDGNETGRGSVSSRAVRFSVEPF
ncbi:hypothetical protein KZZ52_42110 [Dactylosporangium sp. AC04546]|uniref:hypothetical protein n=1 Tax=Dactylosporangium sp. AC04546 TaxID=2862460 RepID=UPI001EDCE088|nr:hypothetical protein [Dactylosporangium sp. AC04546]WVK80517.1 hypothetical protein KZZ52_42110 [Dactylosporangium sp. AC04546]